MYKTRGIIHTAWHCLLIPIVACVVRFAGHIGFGIRIESATKTTAKALQPADTRGRDADTVSVEVLRRGQMFQQSSHVGHLHQRAGTPEGQLVSEQSKQFRCNKG